MIDLDRPIGGDGRAPWPAPQDRSPSPAADELRREADLRLAQMAYDGSEDLETMSGLDRGPALGIALAFVPAVLMWGGLIALGARLL